MIVENPLTEAERGLILTLVLTEATNTLLGNGANAADPKRRDMLLRIASKLSGNPTQIIARRQLPDPPQSS